MRTPAMSIVLAAGLMMAALAQAQGLPGRWDLVARQGRDVYPLWLELLAGPPPGGRFQARTGHALPLVGVTLGGNQVTFPLPAENPAPSPGRFKARLEGDSLNGEITLSNGSRVSVVGRRAPSLVRAHPPWSWGRPIDLLADGASQGRALLAAYRPRMRKDEYLAFMRRMVYEETYGE